MFTLMQENQKVILRLQRALNSAQAKVYTDSVCQECHELLPENTARTHDGLWLCENCKVKHFAPAN
jgi:ribosomal protein L37AE/L43A